MRLRCLFVILAVIGLACDKSAPELLIPCDCKNIPVSIMRYNIKGLITFPEKVNDSYGILIPEFGGGEALPFFAVCSDSTFISLVKTNKLSDSTWVLFDGGIIDAKVNCKGFGATRIKTLKKI